MIIFVQSLPLAIQILSKIFSAFVVVLVAFSFHRISQYLKVTLIFFLSSIALLGTCVGACFLFRLKFLTINNSVIYFDLSAKTIIACAICAYLVSSALLRFYNRTLSKKEVYSLVIKNNEITVSLRAFLDTGNHLREPFSNEPVILAKSCYCAQLAEGTKTRLVPLTTVSGASFVKAFKPDQILLKSPNGEELIENAYIGLVEDLGSENYQAILNYDILSI